METGKEKINTPVLLVFDGMIEAGYLFQGRLKRLKGFGTSLKLGYRAKTTFMWAGQSKDSEAIDSNELDVEFGRYDIWHGPFVQLNVLF